MFTQLDDKDKIVQITEAVIRRCLFIYYEEVICIISGIISVHYFKSTE